MITEIQKARRRPSSSITSPETLRVAYRRRSTAPGASGHRRARRRSPRCGPSTRSRPTSSCSTRSCPALTALRTCPAEARRRPRTHPDHLHDRACRNRAYRAPPRGRRRRLRQPSRSRGRGRCSRGSRVPSRRCAADPAPRPPLDVSRRCLLARDTVGQVVSGDAPSAETAVGCRSGADGDDRCRAARPDPAIAGARPHKGQAYQLQRPPRPPTCASRAIRAAPAASCIAAELGSNEFLLPAAPRIPAPRGGAASRISSALRLTSRARAKVLLVALEGRDRNRDIAPGFFGPLRRGPVDRAPRPVYSKLRVENRAAAAAIAVNSEHRRSPDPTILSAAKTLTVDRRRRSHARVSGATGAAPAAEGASERPWRTRSDRAIGRLTA